MINRKIERFVYKLNSFINANAQLFKNNFCIKVILNIENKTIFKNDFCGAITAKGAQCSRKNQTHSMFCGLHRCDELAHKRKRTKTINYLDINDNKTSSIYEIVFSRREDYIDMNNMTELVYKDRTYLLDNITSLLYQKTDDLIIELGNFYRFNFDFEYV